MKARFFYAPPCYNTWPKLYVLTEDGKLYSEYLNFMRPATDIKKFDFASFQASDYKWDGYQSLTEINYQSAITKELTRQENWVERYVKVNHLNDVSIQDASVSITGNMSLSPEFQGILNYSNYFKAGDGRMDVGKHGPEIFNGKLYMSIFHYLEYVNKGPRNYDTFSLGRHLTEKSIHYLTCKYSAQSFSINKFELDLLKQEEINFSRFKK